MNGNVSNITTEQRNWIVKYEEGQLGDITAIEIEPSKMSQKISAFANADGGELWIGVEEERVTKRRSWRGFQRPEDANAHVEILDKVMQLGQGYSFEFLRHQSSASVVLHIEVGKMRQIIYATNGKAYIRRGAHDQPVTDNAMLRQLERNMASYLLRQQMCLPTPILSPTQSPLGHLCEMLYHPLRRTNG